MVESSDAERRRMRETLSDEEERERALEVRRYFLTRLAIVAGAVWLFSWPIHLLPHTVLWVFLAIVALLIGLTATPRTPRATRNTMPKQSP
jgi:fatty acid desaturase